ncbi:MAG: hypothetical protein HYY84_04080 [Deltaproteobacteria bacterium]|nr:hypothetical protein [Deltaproteobacteria bacterium]
MRKSIRIIVASALCTGALSSNEKPASAASFGAGVVMRPNFCLKNCSTTVFSIGPEVSWKYFAFAWRFAFEDGVTYHNPDIRFAYEIPLGPISVAPLLEFTPMFGSTSGISILQLIIRPGVRVYWKPIPLLALFVEPFALDVGFYSKVSSGSFSMTSSDLSLRYHLGFGAAFRF